MKKSKLAVFQSIMALILCLAMLTGTTFAWFTDSESTGTNIIKTGDLRIAMSWTNDMSQDPVNWQDASNGSLFNYQYWEPGFTDLKYLKVDNIGNLAFQYQMEVIPFVPDTGSGTAAAPETLKLAEAIDVYVGYVSAPYLTREEAVAGLKRVGTLSDLMNTENGIYQGILLPENGSSNVQLPAQDAAVARTGSETVCIMLKMREDAGNEYMNCSAGDGFCVRLSAVQYTYEVDSFGNDYDSSVRFPELINTVYESAAVTVDNGVTSAAVTMGNTDGGASVPAGVKVADGTTQLELSITAKPQSDANVTLDSNEELRALDVHMEGVSPDNTVPMIINMGPVMPVGLNTGNLKLYHVENGTASPMTQKATAAEVANHNDFYYDPATGNLTVAMATFSEITAVADLVNAWKGTVATAFGGGSGTEAEPYLIANADQLAYMGDRVSNENGTYGSVHYKLMSDINIGGIENYNTNGRKVLWYPIGYNKVGGDAGEKGNWYTYGGAFSGTFDGAGHTISGIYQNTWAMVGDYDGTYYNDAMGLFGYVNGGTVKNLTIDNFYSEGEFAPTGCVAAYAAGKATFENIAITNSHPQTYNTGVAGIVGWDDGGDTEAEASGFTFKNITIDSSNTISALWGSWDVAAAGLLGYLGEYSTANLNNCHVSATIDVYNDVCGNYQYYWYRYCGMLIGTVDKTKADGSLDLSNITATGCTVDFGDRHEYYYCEFVANSPASYTHDHQFSRIKHSDLTFTDSNGNGRVDVAEVNTVTGCKHDHVTPGYETEDIDGDGIVDSDVLLEDKQAVHIPFRQIFGGYGWGVKGTELGENLSANIKDITHEAEPDENGQIKFETKFTGNFLYRVGNANTVSVGSLFAAAPGMEEKISDAGVYVRIDKHYENSNVTCIFTPSTTGNWEDGTLKFEGTGVVDISIQDYDYCKPTTLHLEVVDAVNATSATSATKNNVVLLNDCGFSSLEVSGGYTLYGNGFTMTCERDSVAADMGYAFVTLNNGTLDNVQIVCPNFDYAALYKSNLTSSDNRSETDSNGKTRYYNAKSGVMASGNSQILNSRISGGRAAVTVSGGNVVIDNSRIELGAVANILVGAANSLTLRDVTLVQKPTVSTHDSSKTLMGFSVLYLCDSEGKATPTTLEGSFVQQAWVNADDKQYVPSAGQDIVDGVMKETAFIHNINGKDSLNLGFAYMPEDAQKTVAAPDNITDNRTDKATIPYEMKDVKIQISILSTTVYVYSYKNTNGTADSFKTETGYVPDKYGDIITVTYSDTTDGLTTGKSYGTDGWVYELNVDLDKLSGYALDFSKLTMSVNGVTVTDFKVDGNMKPTSPKAVTAGGTTYTLTATVNGKEYTATYKVTGTETSKESPSLVASNYEAGLCVASSYGGTWHGAAPALEGIQIKYWSVAEQQYKTINLSDYTPTTAGKQNGTNTTWTYSPDNGDFTLTLTGGQVHSSNNVYAMPVVCDEKLYFVAASSKGLVNSGNSARTIPVTYTFKDNNNGGVLTFSNTWSVAENKDEQYNYSDFCNGTLTELKESSGGGCVTPDTLITLADGSQVRVDSLTGNEELLVWNMETGKLDSAPILFVDSDPEDEYEIVHLYFSDGTDVKVIYEHGFWDYDLNRYVYLDADAAQYIGHTFAKQNGSKLRKVQLTNVVIETERTTAWSPVTEGHLCYFVNGMLSMPGGVGGLFNIFEVDPATMTYDYEAMERDIQTYGLFTYEELNAIAPLSEEMFYAAGGAYLKVSIGKGNLTMDELITMINRYSKFF